MKHFKQKLPLTIVCIISLSISQVVFAQGSFKWEDAGLISGISIPDGFQYQAKDPAKTTITVNNTITNDNGTLVNPDVKYDAGTLGDSTGYARLEFTANEYHSDDKVCIKLSFSNALTGLKFSILDIDAVFNIRGILQYSDAIEVHYNGNNNIKDETGITKTYDGSCIRDNTANIYCGPLSHPKLCRRYRRWRS